MSITLEQLAYRLLPPVRPGRALADREWATLCCMAETLLEDTQVSLPPAQIADNVEHFLIRGQSQRAWRVRVLLTLVEWMPVTAVGRSMSQLAAPERRALVENHFVLGGGLWQICAKVRLFVLMGAYGDATAALHTGFVPMGQRARFSERRSLPVRRGVESLPSLSMDAQ